MPLTLCHFGSLSARYARPLCRCHSSVISSQTSLVLCFRSALSSWQCALAPITVARRLLCVSTVLCISVFLSFLSLHLTLGSSLLSPPQRTSAKMTDQAQEAYERITKNLSFDSHGVTETVDQPHDVGASLSSSSLAQHAPAGAVAVPAPEATPISAAAAPVPTQAADQAPVAAATPAATSAPTASSLVVPTLLSSTAVTVMLLPNSLLEARSSSPTTRYR